MSLACHCYICMTLAEKTLSVCNVDCLQPASDTQNLILQVCKGIFEAIQNKNTSAEIICLILHEEIHNNNEIENCIIEEFNRYDISISCKEIKRFSTDTWRIRFEWNEFNNDSLIKNLLKLLKEWYDPFPKYLQHVDRQKRNEWLSDKGTNKNEDKLKQNLLDNLKDYLPGFKYLIEYSWDSYDDNNNLQKGDFIFASDSGVFIVVEVNKTHEDSVKTKALKCKTKASEKFFGKYITLIGATFTNFTIELNDINDKSIMQNLKEFHSSQDYLSRNKSQSTSNSSVPTREGKPKGKGNKEESLSISSTSDAVVAGVLIGIAAAAAIGCVICSRDPIKTVVVATGTVIYKVYQDYRERNNGNKNIT